MRHTVGYNNFSSFCEKWNEILKNEKERKQGTIAFRCKRYKNIRKEYVSRRSKCYPVIDRHAREVHFSDRRIYFFSFCQIINGRYSRASEQRAHRTFAR